MIDRQKKAEKGDTKAMASLAVDYLTVGEVIEGDSSEQFFRECLEFAVNAKEANEPEAFRLLASLYENGYGVEQDKDKALEYYTAGSDLGDALCQLSLGVRYITGTDIPEDKEKGFELCMKSAEQGNGTARKAVGNCYQFGHGTEHDMKKAIYWYEKALEIIDDPELQMKVMAFKTLPDL